MERKLRKLFLNYLIDEAGETGLEYSLVLLISLAIISMTSESLKDKLSNMIINLGSTFNSRVNNIS
jgi:Flp pilus assembly pilin Flp